MDITLIVFGLACLIGAIVGGGIKMKREGTELEVPLIASTQRQIMLAALGGILTLAGGYLNYEQRHQFDGVLRGLGMSAAGDPRMGTSDQPDDILAGTWRAPGDGSWMTFSKTDSGYSVVTGKPGGLSDQGSASLEGKRVTLSLQDQMVGTVPGALVVNGNQMAGTLMVAGTRVPVALFR